jgi:ATP-binding cassette subfamily B protein
MPPVWLLTPLVWSAPCNGTRGGLRQLKPWLALLRPHRKALGLALVAAIGEAAADIAQPWPLKIVLDNVLHQHAQHSHEWLNRLILGITGRDPWSVLLFATIAALLIAVAGAVCSYGETYLTTSMGQWVSHEMRLTVYSHVQRLSLAFHDNKRTGDLMSRVTSDIESVRGFLTSGLLDGLVDVLTLGGMIAVMLYIDWRFTLVALSVTPVLFMVVYTYTRKIKKAARDVRVKEGEMVSVMQEVLSSIRVVKAFAREDYEEERLREESLESVEIALQARALKAKLAPLVEIIVAVGTAAVLWFGAHLVLSGQLGEGSMVVFILYLSKMYKPMQDLSKKTDAYSKAAVGLERIEEVLRTNYTVADLPGARRAPHFRGLIELQNVSFHYTSETPILHDVNLRIEPGQIAALVGRTGAGKSTLISLIPRFYDPVSGVVKVDGVDVRRYTQNSLRRQCSFVLQETVLFHAPLWTNIAYGKPDATKVEILRAAELANAHEFISNLPQGYDTLVGERGVTLSGGQRQRIAIARAVIRDSPILILDEPTTGLDAESEKLVFEAMDRLMEGKTVVVIAHRFDTIKRANLIAVLEEGTIQATGTHDDLLQHGGLYAHLYDLQVHPCEEVTSITESHS